MNAPIQVVLLAADHRGSTGLRLDTEIRTVLERTRQQAAACALAIHPTLAVRADDVRHALLRHSPQVVHFSGHGMGDDGIVLDDGTRFDPPRLRTLFSAFPEVRVVVLNACHGLPAAEAIGAVVDHVVAMELPIDDDAAILFSGWFYAAMAAGRDVATAFALARDTMADRYGVDHARPRLLSRPGGRASIMPPRRTAREERMGPVNHAADNTVRGDADLENVGGGNGRNEATGNRIGGSLRMANKAL